MDDQREASGRPDVLVFVSEVLTTPTKISGQPIANLIASTSGSDSDWVVKLIDVYPDEVAGQPALGGYQLMVSADVFRGQGIQNGQAGIRRMVFGEKVQQPVVRDRAKMEPIDQIGVEG